MTNEEAARNLILMFTQWAANYDPGSENLEKGNKAVQIAVYALGNATGNGIQFDKSLKEERFADEMPCPHNWKELPNSIGEKCDICGAVRYKGV